MRETQRDATHAADAFSLRPLTAQRGRFTKERCHEEAHSCVAFRACPAWAWRVQRQRHRQHHDAEHNPPAAEPAEAAAAPARRRYDTPARTGSGSPAAEVVQIRARKAGSSRPFPVRIPLACERDRARLHRQGLAFFVRRPANRSGLAATRLRLKRSRFALRSRHVDLEPHRRFRHAFHLQLSASPTSWRRCAPFLPATRNCAASVAFSVAMIALSAKMAKADGIVTQDEVRAFQEFSRFRRSEARNVARLYDLAKQDIAGFETYAERMARLVRLGPRQLRDAGGHTRRSVPHRQGRRRAA